MDRGLILIWFAVLLSVVGTLLSFNWNAILNFIIAKELRLTPTTKLYSFWQKTPIPVTTEFYFFNWTNPEELMNEGFKPNLVEMGPYKFKEFLEKTNVTWNENSTISFRKLRRWYFDRENSNGSLNDNVTTLNPVALSAAYVSRFRSSFMHYSLSGALRMTGQKVWITKTVGEFLFDGYSDPLLTAAAIAPSLSQAKFKGSKFAWFYMRNDSSDQDGIYNVETGENDVSKLGLVRSWNYENHSDFFEADCGQVKGTVGDLYPPGQKKSTPLQMFTSEICRYIQVDYAEDTEILGIPGYTYVVGKSLLDNGTSDPKNRCNCGGVCAPQGVLNISSCKYGAPGFLSYPHFLDADPYFRNKVNGMNPDRKRHQMYVTLEPTTGIPLDVAARFQMNLLLQPIEGISLYSGVPTIFFPMLWFEESVQITPELAQPLKMLLALPVVGMYCSLGALLLGLFILVFVGAFRVLARIQWSFFRYCEGKGAKKTSNKIVYYDEKSCPLMSPVTIVDENSKMADITIK